MSKLREVFLDHVCMDLYEDKELRRIFTNSGWIVATDRYTCVAVPDTGRNRAILRPEIWKLPEKHPLGTKERLERRAASIAKMLSYSYKCNIVLELHDLERIEKIQLDEDEAYRIHFGTMFDLSEEVVIDINKQRLGKLLGAMQAARAVRAKFMWTSNQHPAHSNMYVFQIGQMKMFMMPYLSQFYKYVNYDEI